MSYHRLTPGSSGLWRRISGHHPGSRQFQLNLGNGGLRPCSCAREPGPPARAVQMIFQGFTYKTRLVVYVIGSAGSRPACT